MMNLVSMNYIQRKSLLFKMYGLSFIKHATNNTKNFCAIENQHKIFIMKQKKPQLDQNRRVQREGKGSGEPRKRDRTELPKCVKLSKIKNIYLILKN